MRSGASWPAYPGLSPPIPARQRPPPGPAARCAGPGIPSCRRLAACRPKILTSEAPSTHTLSTSTCRLCCWAPARSHAASLCDPCRPTPACAGMPLLALAHHASHVTHRPPGALPATTTPPPPRHPPPRVQSSAPDMARAGEAERGGDADAAPCCSWERERESLDSRPTPSRPKLFDSHSRPTPAPKNT